MVGHEAEQAEQFRRGSGHPASKWGPAPAWDSENRIGYVELSEFDLIRLRLQTLGLPPAILKRNGPGGWLSGLREIPIQSRLLRCAGCGSLGPMELGLCDRCAGSPARCVGRGWRPQPLASSFWRSDPPPESKWCEIAGCGPNEIFRSGRSAMQGPRTGARRVGSIPALSDR